MLPLHVPAAFAIGRYGEPIRDQELGYAHAHVPDGQDADLGQWRER